MVVDLNKVTEWSKYIESKPEDEIEYAVLKNEAVRFIEYYDWCSRIVSTYIGIVYPGIIGVFLFNIIANRKDVDEWVWVIVGDLPPAYITCEDCPNPATAIDAYIGAMLDWVSAASVGDSVDKLIPVNVLPTKGNASKLKLRLEFLDEKILSMYSSDLNV